MTIEPFKLIMGAIFVCIFVIYIIHVQLRRRAYKKIAAALNAEYQSQGLFNSGKISGESSGKKFTIENIITSSGKSSTTWTRISVNCQNSGIPLLIQGKFFDNFPNWKYVFTIGDRKEKVFITHINLTNFPSKLEERYRSSVQNLFQETAAFNYDFIRKGRIQVEKDKIIFYKHGVIKNIEIIKQVIQLLIKVVCRIESTPIV